RVVQRRASVEDRSGSSASKSLRCGTERSMWHVIRECRGRESNPLETDLQSVTLAALSPRRRPLNRRGVIETLETQFRGPRAEPGWGDVMRSSNVVCYTISVNSPFHPPFLPGRERYRVCGGRGRRKRRCP